MAKPCIASGSEGADGEEPEAPKPEPPKLEAPDRHEPELPNKPASTEPANTECAICLDDNAEYAAVPCGHRCLCTNCSKTISHGTGVTTMGRCKAVHTTYISTPRCGLLVGYSVEVHNLGAEMAEFSLAESLLAAQDELEAVLQAVDAAAMCQLKAVSGG